MKCQRLFSVKHKKNIIDLSSAEIAQRVVKICRKRVALFINHAFDNNLLPAKTFWVTKFITDFDNWFGSDCNLLFQECVKRRK